MIAVLLLVMTGLIDGASILLGDPGTPSRLYLGVLGAKLALVACMLGLAAVNRFQLIPQGRAEIVARHAKPALGARISSTPGFTSLSSVHMAAAPMGPAATQSTL
jgi:putative copper export protein